MLPARHLGEQAIEIDGDVRIKGSRVAADALEAATAFSQHPEGDVGATAVAVVVEADGDLDQTLEKVPRLGARRAPDFLEGFVAVEMLATIEERDSFLEKTTTIFGSQLGMKVGAGLAGRHGRFSSVDIFDDRRLCG